MTRKKRALSPDEGSHNQPVNAAEARIVQICQNAIDAEAPTIRAELGKLVLTGYNQGIAHGRTQFGWVVQAHLAAIERRLLLAGVPMPQVSGDELVAELRAVNVMGTRAEVVEIAEMVGLPLADTEETP